MTPNSETVQSFSLDGPLAAWQGVVLGVILLALVVWTLFGVRRDARRKTSWVLLVLRTVAVAALVWMLLGPVRATTYRHFTPKSLAVVTDVSGSMNVVDPPNTKGDARWQTAAASGSGSSLVAICDQTVSATALARDQLAAVLQNAQGPPGQLRAHLETAARAGKSAVRLAEKLGRALADSPPAGDSDLVARGKELSSALAASGVDQMGKLLPSDVASPVVLKRDALDRVETWHRQLVTSARALGQLADRIAESEGSKPSGAGAGIESLSRREKVGRLLKAGEKSWLAERAGTSRIRQYAFDQQTVALGEHPAAAKAAPVTPAAAQSPSQASDAAAPAKKEAVTNLSSALGTISRDAPEAGIKAVLLFSDGRHNDPAAQDPRAVAKTLADIPVYVVPVGSSTAPRDVILHHVDAPRAVVEGDRLVVEAIVTASDCAGEKCTVELAEKGLVVDRQEIDIKSARRDFRVRLATTSKGVGRHDYSLKVSPVRGEVSATNNAAEFGVDVIDATLRILAADDVPRWEFRYLIRLFERDKRVQYTQTLFHPMTDHASTAGDTTRLPRTVEEWGQYRLAILGDLSPSELDAQSQQALKEYLVDRGGTVILIAGDQSMPQAFVGMPLADMLPVSAGEQPDPTQGYELALSAEGRLNGAMQITDGSGSEGSDDVWKDMSRQLPIYGLSQFSVPKPTARTLIKAENTALAGSGKDEKAFLCWQTVGRGRIVYVAAPDVYQLRMKYGDRYHYRFWGQLIRWAVARDLSQGSKTVKLATDRSRATVGESVQVIANLSDMGGRPVSGAAVRVQAATGGRAASLFELRADPKIPGRYLGEISPGDEGVLSLQATGADVLQLLATEGFAQAVATTVVVDPTPSVEMEDTRSNFPLLKQIAGLTGGQVVSPAAVGQLVELTNLEPSVHEETTRQPLWNRWGLLWIFCGVLSAEWALRKATGLP